MTQSQPRTTRDELLAPVPRWTALFKFFLCDGIRRGTITVAEAQAAHAISGEEIGRWYTAFKEEGYNGLRRPHLVSRRRRS